MKKSWSAGILAVFLLVANLSYADGIDDLRSLLENASDSTESISDDGLLRLTPDRTKLLRLDRDAASVIVTNPAHANVVLESQRLLVILPRQPGTTAFTVLDRDGEVILEKNIIVTAAQSKYVRIRRACDGAEGCVESAFYYCPDGCYEVTPVAASDTPMDIPEVVGGTASINNLIGSYEEITSAPEPGDSEEDEEEDDDDIESGVVE